jgi:hypothetical protein
MAEVGDRIAVASKGKPRFGVVTVIKGAMITVRWDTGVETSLIPGPGVLSVVTSRRRTPSAQTRPTTLGATAAARETSAAGSRSGVARKAARAKKVPAGKKPVARKVPAGKKPVAKGTSFSRTTGKKSR